ncbi:phage tail tape measure protein [Heyndrickxia coagulans]|uniref:Tail length tape measure protein n=1 Tax=Heyndrickxia coagulans TaxID=1398 RepID=A0AAN0WC94_HEYCO|nr:MULTISPECIES: phage tail tape measure protein [Heyndrickxia]NWN93804.1 phage tail tape measure protein [Bacillus sp. (in: firmicutes)]AJO22889.1 tail length tape measure protein [Heyndrickxia coagulans]MBT2236210.1 phage tail tape measure protein [Heyndrickxia coagulans]MCR4444265.1 phage tail tape measure protein [Heyndrickxia coagulans]NEV21202.1 phage tail tape measure protein [Heyndrickxia coagulans]
MAGDQPLGNMVIGVSMEGTQFANTLKEIRGQVRQAQSAMKANLTVISGAGDKYETLRAKVKSLNEVMAVNQREIDMLRKKHREAIKTYGEGSEQVSKLASQVNNAVAKQSAWSRQLDQAKSKLSGMDSPISKFSSRLNDISERAKSVGGKVKEMSDGITQTFAPATIAIGAGLGAAAKQAMDFESQMSAVKSVMAPDEVKKYGGALEDLAVTMGAKTKYSATEAAQGIEELVKAGVKTTDIIHGGLSGALNLATAGELDLKDAAEIASTALNAFRKDNISVTRAADLLAGAANASATDVEELKYGLSAVSAVASGVGLSFEDTTTALAAFAQNGLKGQDAGTSLKTMLLNLSPSTKSAADMMDSLGLAARNTSSAYNWLVDRGIKPASHSANDIEASLQRLAKIQAGAGASASKVKNEYQELAKNSGFASSAFYDQNGKLKSLSKISGLLHDRLKNLSEEQRQYALKTMFGTDAIRAANILYKEGAKGIEDMNGAMNKIKAADVAKKKMDNLKGSIEQLKGSLETAGISVGQALTPAIKKTAEFVQNIVDKFNALPKPVQHAAAISAALLAVILTLVTGFGFLTSGISSLVIAYGTLAGGMAATTGVIAAEGAAATAAGASTGILAGAISLLTSPVTLTIAAIAALAAVFVIAYNKSKPFHDFINGIGASLMKAFGFVKQFTVGIMQMFQGNWAGGADILSKIGLSDSAVQKTINIVTAIQNTFNILKGYLQQALSAVGSFVMSKITELKIFWDANGASIIQATKNIFSFLAVIIKAALAILTPIFKIGFGVFVTIIKSVWGNIKGIISGSLQVIEGIIQVFSGLFTGNWKKMWQGIKNIFSGTFKVLINWIQLNFIGKMLRVARGFVGPFKSIFSGLWGAMKSIFSAPIKWIGNIVKNGFNGMKNKAIGIFSSMKNGASKIWSSMVSTIKGLPGRMANGLKNGAGKLKSAMISVGNAMIKGLGKGVNGVRNGINWILEKVHAPKKLRIPKWNVPQYAKGTDNHPGGFALLSDGKGKHKQELVTLPTGESFLSPVRETIMNLPKGTSVLNANATNQLLSIMPKYANGTGWLEKAWDVTKSAASKAVSGAKNVGKSILGGVKTVWDYATHPSKLISKAVSAFTNLSGLAQPTLGMVSGAVSMAKKGAKNWIKSLMGGGDNPGGSGVERWRSYVVKALEMNGLSTSKAMVEKVLRQIKTESGGNPKAVQHGYTDINAITGDLAKGLMQTISATFNAYKFPGHNDIFNGFDNLLAALNYAKHRHGKNLSGLGEGHGYANGGFVFTEQLARVAEGNKPEAIIPLDRLKRTRALQLLSQTQKALGVGSQSQSNSSAADLSALIQRQDQQISLMQQTIDLLMKILQKNNVIKIDADALEKNVSKRQAANYNNAAYMMG